MAREDPQLNVRIPITLKHDLEEAAAESGRSVTQELIHRLTRSLSVENEISEVRSALYRVITFDEQNVLRQRVTELGGFEKVNQTPIPELMAQINRDDPAIVRTKEQRQSFFSARVKDMPLQAILTTEEIAKIAERLSMIEDSRKKVMATAKKKPPEGG